MSDADATSPWGSGALQPLTTDAPCGVDASTLPEFESVRSHIVLMSTQDATQVPWDEVVKVTGSILNTKSKDLRIACWGTLGLFRRQRFEGLATGLGLLQKLHGDWWQAMHPSASSPRSRLNVFQSTMERLVPWVTDDPPSPGEAAHVKTCLEVVRSLQQRAAEAYGPQADLHDLSGLEEALSTAAAGSPTETVARQPGPGTRPFTSSGDVRADVRDLGKRLPDMARELLALKASDPVGYRLLRVGVWMRPVVPEQGRLQIPGPEKVDADSQLAALSAAEASPELLKKLEQLVAKQPYWLDLQPLVCRKLHDLGSEYAEAEAVVRAECAALVARTPDLVNSQFARELPVATPASRSWFRALGAGAGSRAPEAIDIAVTRSARADDDAVVVACKSASAKAAGGGLKEALGIVAEAIARAAAAPDRVELRMHLARLMLEGGLHEAAAIHLEAVEAELGALRVEVWEPALLQQVLVMLCGAYQRLPEASPDVAGKLRRARARLIEIDPTSAPALSSRPSAPPTAGNRGR